MRWRPAHEDHAIERVALTLQFVEPIPQKTWTTLLNGALSKFPQIGFNQTIQNISIVVPPPPFGFSQIVGGQGGMISADQAATATIPGRTFQVVSDNQVREEVTLQREFFIYATSDYQSWAACQERAFSLLAQAIESALATINVNNAKLEYWDRFVFDGPINDADYGQLLRADSSLLPKFGLGINELWHSHIGYFTPTRSNERRLVNFNVDVLDLIDAPVRGPSTPKRSVGLYSMAQDTFQSNDSPQSVSAISSTFDDMHTILKAALGDVITAEAADRIYLNAQVPK
jgi:uncharacterized protein (TIGR04255 family)